jgi:hypothetical protein
MSRIVSIGLGLVSIGLVSVGLVRVSTFHILVRHGRLEIERAQHHIELVLLFRFS